MAQMAEAHSSQFCCLSTLSQDSLRPDALVWWSRTWPSPRIPSHPKANHGTPQPPCTPPNRLAWSIKMGILLPRAWQTRTFLTWLWAQLSLQPTLPLTLQMTTISPQSFTNVSRSTWRPKCRQPALWLPNKRLLLTPMCMPGADVSHDTRPRGQYITPHNVVSGTLQTQPWHTYYQLCALL